MVTKNELLTENQPGTETDKVLDGKSNGTGKKRFVEPEISVAVDVLEATTFFQTATSGAV